MVSLIVWRPSINRREKLLFGREILLELPGFFPQKVWTVIWKILSEKCSLKILLEISWLESPEDGSPPLFFIPLIPSEYFSQLPPTPTNDLSHNWIIMSNPKDLNFYTEDLQICWWISPYLGEFSLAFMIPSKMSDHKNNGSG